MLMVCLFVCLFVWRIRCLEAYAEVVREIRLIMIYRLFEAIGFGVL